MTLRVLVGEAAATLFLSIYCTTVIVICGAMELPAHPDPALTLPARTTAHAVAGRDLGSASAPDRMGLFILASLSGARSGKGPAQDGPSIDGPMRQALAQTEKRP
jgi:hypothetical protein